MKIKDALRMNKKKLIIISIILIMSIIAVLYNIKLVIFYISDLFKSQPYICSTKWGGYGVQDGKFRSPVSIAVDSENCIYILDQKKEEIQKFDSDGNFLLKWKKKFIKKEYNQINITEISDPRAIGVDNKDNIYVIYSFCYIAKFNSEGTFLEKFEVEDLEGAICIDSEGYIYTTSLSLTIQIFNPKGELISNIPAGSPQVGGQYLYDIALDSKKNIYVLYTSEFDHHGSPIALGKNYINTYIYKYNSEGELLNQWGIDGQKNKGFNYASGITIDSEDHIFITEAGENQVYKLDTNGKIIAKWGTEGIWCGQFENPVDLAVDRAGNIYVLDAGNYRVQKFKPNLDFKGK